MAPDSGFDDVDLTEGQASTATLDWRSFGDAEDDDAAHAAGKRRQH